jgi:hypothetical protein
LRRSILTIRTLERGAALVISRSTDARISRSADTKTSPVADDAAPGVSYRR